MSVDFEHSIEIARPADEVFAYLSDFENNPRWQNGMKSCAWTSARTREVGSTYVQVAQFLGRRIDTHFRVTELVPGRRISIESTQSTFPIQVTRKVEPLGDARCRVTAHIRGQPTGLFKVLAGSPFDFVQRSVRKDYDRLKAVLESESR